MKWFTSQDHSFSQRLKIPKQDKCWKSISKVISDIECEIKQEDIEKQDGYVKLEDDAGAEDEVLQIHDVPCDHVESDQD